MEKEIEIIEKKKAEKLKMIKKINDETVLQEKELKKV